MLIDSHCHLCLGPLDADRDAVLERARAAGVGRLINVGTTIRDFPHVRAVSDRYDDVYCSVGVHPHEAGEPGEQITADQLVPYAADPKIVAFGEAGLDYFYDHAPREAQQRIFREHIRACLATDMPLIVHTREAEQDTIAIFEEETAGNEGKLRGVMHCYSSNIKLAEYALSIGFYISFSGMITFKKSENVREVARIVPLDRLLVETDAPYLAPEPYRGKLCEPAYVAETAKYLAQLKGVGFAEFESIQMENFFNLFTKVQRP